MEAERWQQIEAVFQAAIDCQPEARAGLLDSLCGNDHELREEIESLLAVHGKSSFTAAAAFDEAMSVLDRRTSELCQGRRLGPYRVIREIGHGGMGTVFLAARADDAYQKHVAIKLIRQGLDTEDIIRRFRSERQILASLDHPNITRLLDAGTTDDGLPYYVMEYIEGETIDQYCDARTLNISERLKLFQSVCSAVSYAHRNLVIHRDIKPGNVLVTKEGVPRLLDFGIAKLLAPGGAQADETVTGLRPLTPEYASPEQLRGETLTTASDVYSLGVLLYGLLSGHRPYRGAMSTLTEVEHAVCEEEPERPSIIVLKEAPGRDGTSRVTPESVSKVRGGSSPDKLRRRLHGDLDNIALMALRKEAQRRYASAEQLSEDIGRHLDKLPIIARPNTAGYRAAKFATRHKAGVAAAALLLLTLSAGIAATTWQARRAAAESKRARIEAAKAQRINAFLQDMLTFSSPGFGSSNPHKNPDARVSDVVDRAARRAPSELADQPEVLAEMQRTIGEVYYAEGHYDEAEQMLRAARENYLRIYGKGSQESVEATTMLANTLLRKGNMGEADNLFRESIETERRQAKAGHLDSRLMAYALGDYGSMLDMKADKAAESYLREALQYASKFTGKERAYVAMVYNDLGDVAYRSGDLNKAEQSLRAAIQEYHSLPGGEYVEMGAALSNLGAILIKEKRYADAEPLIREGLDVRRRLLGNAHPDTAMSLFRLSDLFYRQGKYPEAESAVRESLEVFQRAYTDPKKVLNYSSPMMALGLTLNKTGRPREAEPYLREAVDIRTRLLSPGDQLIGTAEGALGECLTTQREYAAAEPILLDSYRVLKAALGDNDPRTIEAVQRLVGLYQGWHKAEKASGYSALLPRTEAAIR
jgi:serine/threonine protein kinase